MNTLKTNREDLIHRLEEYGYTVYKTKYARDGIVVENPRRITEIEEFKQGFFYYPR